MTPRPTHHDLVVYKIMPFLLFLRDSGWVSFFVVVFWIFFLNRHQEGERGRPNKKLTHGTFDRRFVSDVFNLFFGKRGVDIIACKKGISFFRIIRSSRDKFTRRMNYYCCCGIVGKRDILQWVGVQGAYNMCENYLLNRESYICSSGAAVPLNRSSLNQQENEFWYSQ